MEDCVVVLERLPIKQISSSEFEEIPRRRSQRIIMKQVGQKIPNVSYQPSPRKNRKLAMSIKKNVGNSASKTQKSIIKVSGMRGRSKSVSFDPAIVSPIKPVRRNLFGATNGVLHDNGNEKLKLVQMDDQNLQDVAIDLTLNRNSKPKTACDIDAINLSCKGKESNTNGAKIGRSGQMDSYIHVETQETSFDGNDNAK